jgi:hypothetical protein
MLGRLRSGAIELVGLFVTDWLSAAVALAVLAGGWALARQVHNAAPGFAMAGALAALVVAEAVLRGRRLGAARAHTPDVPPRPAGPQP